ncbi:hypothetical protein V518_1937 [Thermoanaerobacterium aotearoense SCUT27]|uniref:Uncharacterized protein n=2 Tax=Thermoanaerobacterium TaxID=28895 RepID=W9EDP0_9THEO|nr:hypothetical protein Tsac_0698 [Thermoanaerobacterium saccharolyticum JW/SL-YS485]ETO37864.1 hypothetical protein V518_1937 [Thermoanaerobacterium aotearoense SCUT27]
MHSFFYMMFNFIKNTLGGIDIDVNTVYNIYIQY